MVCATREASDQPAHTYSLIIDFASRLNYSMSVKQLTENDLEFLSLTGGCTGSSFNTCQNATLLEIACRGSYIKYIYSVSFDCLMQLFIYDY